MLNKIFTIIIILNAVLVVTQSALSISLSTKGDILSSRLLVVEQMRNQIDILENQIADSGNLDKAYSFAVQRGFVPIKIIHFTPESLAHVFKN